MFDSIFNGINLVSKEVPVIFPAHPRTSKKLEETGVLGHLNKNFNVIEPIGYLDMLMLEKKARLIATDSGGVQKEAFFYKVPCVTLRTETEWVELVNASWNRLADIHNSNEIYKTIMKNLDSKGREIKPYGDGDASQKIVKIFNNMISK